MPLLCRLALLLILFVTPLEARAQVGFSLPEQPGAAAAPDDGQGVRCQGRDLLDEMAKTEPELLERITSEASKVENGEAMLWRVEKAGVAPSHILGTVHLSDPRVATLSAAARSAIDQSRKVFLEVGEVSSAGAAAAMLEARHLAFFVDGRRLDHMMPAEDYASAEAAVARAGIPPKLLPMLKPWLVTLILAGTECEREAVADGAVVLDMAVANAAKSRGIPVEGLETARSQLEAMASVPEAQQIEMLKAAVRTAPRINDLTETMIRLYQQRRITATWPLQMAIAEKAGVPPSAFSGFKSEIVSKRNRGMHAGARESVAAGGAFIAVGALHLSGPDGLVALFRNDGFVVTPLE